MSSESTQQMCYQKIALKNIEERNFRRADNLLQKVEKDTWYKIPIFLQLAKTFYQDGQQEGSNFNFAEAEKTADQIGKKSPYFGVRNLIRVAKAKAQTLPDINQAKNIFRRAKEMNNNEIPRNSFFTPYEDRALLWKINGLIEIAKAEKETGCEEYKKTIKQYEELFKQIKDEKTKNEASKEMNDAQAILNDDRSAEI